MSGFTTILIANRGEIAVRVIRSAKSLGYETVAVYSDADRDALHVREADRAVRIGPPPVGESYLKIDAIIAAAKTAGADAVHPGYGFLSENAAFAQACADAGLTFIGPTAEAIDLMGNKAAAKRRMIEAEVPCVPGYQGAEQDDATLQKQAEDIGWPVMVKAAAGGGGRGMRLVDDGSAFLDSLTSARSEAKNAFGSDELILEKAVIRPRHVEIQVLADSHGHVIHLGERDCSVQRRHQKVVEEAPSPAVSPELRARMGTDAVAAAQAIGYVGAGTVEFLLDNEGHYYFLEMNTRLQVEHPVTEMITGLDLVAWQIRIAGGEHLTVNQDDVTLDGHAIEVRLYAEDPAAGFLPQTGTVLRWSPPTGDGVRVDHGLVEGQEISPHYDPMVAKVVAHGATRDVARRRLIRALAGTELIGVASNRAFLMDVLAHDAFAAGEATTAFIDEHCPPDSLRAPGPDATLLALAAVLYFEHANAEPDSISGWRSTGAAAWPLSMHWGDGGQADVSVNVIGDGCYDVLRDDHTVFVQVLEKSERHVRYAAGNLQQSARFAFDRDGGLYLDDGHNVIHLSETLLAGADSDAGAGDGVLLAPMSGRILAVHAKPGDAVEKGQRLAILEAMKMEHEITADTAGVVEQVGVAEGDQVTPRQLLIALAPAE